MIKILVVEDDENIARMIEAALSIGGYHSARCADGGNAVGMVLGGGYDLVLLDVMLPGMDGFEVMEHIRQAGTPVIFLTALQEVADKVRGLRLGADDYIVKPFEAVELLARIEVVLRRFHKAKNELQYGDLVVNVEEHTAKKAGRMLPLTPKEFDMLVFFLEHQDIALTRERLLSAVWGYEFMGETRTVDIHVQQLRKKADLYHRLVTVPKLGYRLESWNE
jgi:DNA-binding response OmpR family regulator